MVRSRWFVGVEEEERYKMEKEFVDNGGCFELAHFSAFCILKLLLFNVLMTNFALNGDLLLCGALVRVGDIAGRNLGPVSNIAD